MLFYLVRGHEAATGEQKALIEEIRANQWGLARDKRDFLNSRSPAGQRRCGGEGGCARVPSLRSDVGRRRLCERDAVPDRETRKVPR